MIRLCRTWRSASSGLHDSLPFWLARWQSALTNTVAINNREHSVERHARLKEHCAEDVRRFSRVSWGESKEQDGGWNRCSNIRAEDQLSEIAIERHENALFLLGDREHDLVSCSGGLFQH